MKTLLRIDSSFRLKNSYSRIAGDTFVKEWKILNPIGIIKNREMGFFHVPHLDQVLYDEFYQAQNPSDGLRLSDELIAELIGCDEILITVPMYNFGIPSSLKAYFDLVVRMGKTFLYQDQPIGLLQNKKAYILSSMGDFKSDSPNLVEMHLQQILNFMGVTDISYYSLDGTADKNHVNQQLRNQKKSIRNILNQ